MNEDKKIEFVAGDTPSLEFVVKNDGVPFPLDSVDINFVMSDFYSDIPILTKTTNDFTKVNNVATLKFSSNDTIDLGDTYKYQIAFSDEEGNTSTIEGLLYIIRKIQ